jgi:hypothetical protein
MVLGLVAVLLAALGPGPVSAETLTHQEDQRIDEGLGLFDRPWDLNLVNVNSRLDQLLQVRPGFPPYDQQVEHAQRVPEKKCFNMNMQQVPCP